MTSRPSPGAVMASGGVFRGEDVLAMCRWMAYSGEPILADALLFRPEHSIIDQSLRARMGGFTTNGDGFGIGWYGGEGDGGAPAGVQGAHPARDDENPREGGTQKRTPPLL